MIVMLTIEESLKREKGMIFPQDFSEKTVLAVAHSRNCIEALEKRIPREIKRVMCNNCKKESCQGCEEYYNRCPSCGEGLDRDSGEVFKYCPKCGQALCQK